VLAERLARRFGRTVGYSVLPYEAELHAQLFAGAGAGLRLLIGCVDNLRYVWPKSAVLRFGVSV
jgi:hypothetical protein